MTSTSARKLRCATWHLGPRTGVRSTRISLLLSGPALGVGLRSEELVSREADFGTHGACERYNHVFVRVRAWQLKERFQNSSLRSCSAHASAMRMRVVVIRATPCARGVDSNWWWSWTKASQNVPRYWHGAHTGRGHQNAPEHTNGEDHSHAGPAVTYIAFAGAVLYKLSGAPRCQANQEKGFELGRTQ